MRKCWCGNTNFSFFSPQYSKCSECGTLVSMESLSNEQLIVHDDEVDFYGKQYWLNHQNQDLGFPNIHVRSRNDLPERNLHWLKALLKYALPPANIIELGCAHGGFVALAQQAGFSASGLEMSDWVISFSQDTFNIPVYRGPIEELDLPHGSLDVIALMDVLEHLPNPLATLEYCTNLLKPNGFFLIQTPEFKEEMVYADLVQTDSPFLQQFKADEHLYLFSQASVENCLRRVGLTNICYEPAIFHHYDMFLVASKDPIQSHTEEEIEQALLSTPNGRMILAMLDARELADYDSRAREASLSEQLESAKDQISTLAQECNRRLEQINALRVQLDETILDSTNRLGQIHTLMALLKEAETQSSSQLEQISSLLAQLNISEADRADRLEQVHTLTALLKEAEIKYTSQLEQIEALSNQGDKAKIDCLLD